MTNFDYLTHEEKFHPFSAVAVSAEKILHIDPSAFLRWYFSDVDW